MKKNVYSLVLSEGVVNAVDALAYREGTNRSALINRILAEYLSYTTPEMRIREIFKSIGELFERSAFRIAEPSETALSMRSSLAYKYNPSVRYSLELSRSGKELGVLKVNLRTQNESLLLAAARFYAAFVSVEEKHIGTCRYTSEEGKFLRVFELRANSGGLDGMLSAEDIGKLIGGYIEMFDMAFKTYFVYMEDSAFAYEKIDAIYRAYLSKCKQII